MSWLWQKMASREKEHIAIKSECGRLIAKVYAHPGEAKFPDRISDRDLANAKLIAEAPAMAQQLAALINFIDCYGIYDTRGNSHYGDIADILHSAKESLSKIGQVDEK